MYTYIIYMHTVSIMYTALYMIQNMILYVYYIRYTLHYEYDVWYVR